MNLFLRYIPSGLLMLLLLLMLRNRAYKVSPWFFSYVAFGVSADVARFAVDSYPHRYYVTYWSTEAGYCVLGVLAMYEVFRAVLRDRTWWTYLVFPAIVIAAVVLTWGHAHAVPPKVGGLLLYIVAGEIVARFVQALILIGLGALALLFGHLWGRYSLGAAAGFGFYSTIELLNMIKFSDLGTRFAFLWRTSSLVAYSLAVLIWIWFFRVPQPEVPPLDSERVTLAVGARNQYPPRSRRIRRPLVCGLRSG
jgi:hypothetical protein